MCGVHHRLWGKLCASVEVQAEESSKLGQGWCLCDRLLPYVSRRNTSHMVRTFTIKMLLLLLLSRFSRVRLCATPETAATRLPYPWDSPGKNTGVGCHFLLQCMQVKSESEVAQSCPTLSNLMDCSPPGSSIHGIFQARGLEWGIIAFSVTNASTS